jgi:hypothetical protein
MKMNDVSENENDLMNSTCANDPICANDLEMRANDPMNGVNDQMCVNDLRVNDLMMVVPDWLDWLDHFFGASSLTLFFVIVPRKTFTTLQLYNKKVNPRDGLEKK